MVNKANFPRRRHLHAITFAAAVTAVGLIGAGSSAAQNPPGTSIWTVTINIAVSPVKIVAKSVPANANDTGCKDAGNVVTSPHMHVCPRDQVTFNVVRGTDAQNQDLIVVFADGKIFGPDPSHVTDTLRGTGSVQTKIGATGNITTIYCVAVYDPHDNMLYAADPKIMIGSGSGKLSDIKKGLEVLEKDCPQQSNLIDKLIRKVDALKQEMGVR